MAESSCSGESTVFPREAKPTGGPGEPASTGRDGVFAGFFLDLPTQIDYAVG